MRDYGYDKIAAQYDGLFLDESSIKENEIIMDKIKNLIEGKVLDVGCGTGLLLDYIKIPPHNYYGIDISPNMLNILKRKHPDYINRVKNLGFEDVTGKYNVVLALFGVLNYIDSKYFPKIKNLLVENGKYFLMCFKPNYIPLTYIRSSIYIKHYIYTYSFLKGRFLNVYEFNNFYIVENR